MQIWIFFGKFEKQTGGKRKFLSYIEQGQTVRKTEIGPHFQYRGHKMTNYNFPILSNVPYKLPLL